MDYLARPRQRLGFHLEIVDGEMLLYHLDETRILYCNSTATLIWHLCDGKQTINEIIDLLANAYPDAAETMAEDVERTLDQFLSVGAIELG